MPKISNLMPDGGMQDLVENVILSWQCQHVQKSQLLLLWQMKAAIFINISISSFVSFKFGLHQRSRYAQYDSALGGSFFREDVRQCWARQELHGMPKFSNLMPDGGMQDWVEYVILP